MPTSLDSTHEKLRAATRQKYFIASRQSIRDTTDDLTLSDFVAVYVMKWVELDFKTWLNIDSGAHVKKSDWNPGRNLNQAVEAAMTYTDEFDMWYNSSGVRKCIEAGVAKKGNYSSARGPNFQIALCRALLLCSYVDKT